MVKVQHEAEKKTLERQAENEKELRTMTHYEFDRTRKDNLMMHSEIKDVRRYKVAAYCVRCCYIAM